MSKRDVPPFFLDAKHIFLTTAKKIINRAIGSAKGSS